jgi:hypothetical protein
MHATPRLRLVGIDAISEFDRMAPAGDDLQDKASYHPSRERPQLVPAVFGGTPYKGERDRMRRAIA